MGIHSPLSTDILQPSNLRDADSSLSRFTLAMASDSAKGNPMAAVVQQN